MGLVSGTGTAQLHKASHASVTTQLLQARAIPQWSRSCETHSPVLPPPPGTCPRKVPARRLALAGTLMLPEFLTLYTPLTAAQEGLGCLCWVHQGRNASPTPQKKPSVFSPVPSPDSHPSPWSTILKHQLHPEKNSQGAIAYDFHFYQNVSLGFPKHTHEDVWIGLLTKYITITKWKCHWFKFFDARSEKQEVAEKIFISKQLNKLTKNTHYNSTVRFETTSV